MHVHVHVMVQVLGNVVLMSHPHHTYVGLSMDCRCLEFHLYYTTHYELGIPCVLIHMSVELVDLKGLAQVAACALTQSTGTLQSSPSTT